MYENTSTANTTSTLHALAEPCPGGPAFFLFLPGRSRASHYSVPPPLPWLVSAAHSYGRPTEQHTGFTTWGPR